LALYLTEADVDSLLTPAAALAALESCCERMAREAVDNRPRYRHPLEGGTFAVMSAVDRELQQAGVKSYTALGGRASFVVTLFDTAKSELQAVIEADKLGQLRTGAASGVAAKYLAKEGAATLGILGCGWQAESQVACIREAVPTIEKVVAYCRTEKNLKKFCRKLKAEAGETHRDPAGQDIVVTATNSADPVLRGEWLQPGALVCAIGANVPRHRELDNQVLERAAFVCCDSLEQARIESGDLIEPVQQGVLDWLEVHELHEVVAGETSGRASPEDIVLFKSNGLAAWDVAIAAKAVELARERGVGHALGFTA
jgi:ornithine cyclodeaminase/alanine dehydrogenase-like protein (mu-crystallin family)